MKKRILKEAINTEADLLLKLRPLPESDIFEFMKNLRGGTYFNMGMYNSIPVSSTYKSTIRIYKVLNLSAIVSGVNYENIGTTKEFRAQTGSASSGSWYDHKPGYENKVGVKKTNPAANYVLWDIKAKSDTWVKYYVVDLDAGTVDPVNKEDVLNSVYLTASEKNKLRPKAATGYDLKTGELVTNKTNWRTASFDHIFWLSQDGQNTKEYGAKFTEALKLKEDAEDNSELFRDAAVNVKCRLDDILAGKCHKANVKEETFKKPVVKNNLEEEASDDVFVDGNANKKCVKLDSVLGGTKDSGYTHLVDNDLFVDFD